MGISTLISTSTASNAATVSITSGIDSTYDEYMFVCTDINPATDGANFQFDCSTDGGSNYGMTITSTFFQTTHYEDDQDAYGPSYNIDGDLKQETGFQYLTSAQGNGADESGAGILRLFSPSNTTYAKNFISRFSDYSYSDIQRECYGAGYVNSTSDVDAIQFKMTSGNFDGVIQMYGIA